MEPGEGLYGGARKYVGCGLFTVCILNRRLVSVRGMNRPSVGGKNGYFLFPETSEKVKL